MPRLVRELLVDILDEARFLAQEARARTREEFLSDDITRRAFVRSIEIIGEAAKKIPDDIRAMDATIPWRSISGMRDRLIHDYSGVDYVVVWDVATREATTLIERIEAILQQLPS